MGKIIKLTESDLLRLVKKVIKEQSKEIEGWDKLKEGERIKLRNDLNGTITNWIVSATSPNPSKSGSGTKLFLSPDDEAARNLTPDEIEVSFYPKEMKIDLPGGINSIVKDSIVKKTPTNTPSMKPDPNKPKIIKTDLDKKGFYSLYNFGRFWDTSSKALSGFHINKNNIDVSNGAYGKNKFCLINGTTPDNLNIVLKYNCKQQDYPKGKLFIVQVGNQKLNVDVENIKLTNDIANLGCNCPQG